MKFHFVVFVALLLLFTACAIEVTVTPNASCSDLAAPTCTVTLESIVDVAEDTVTFDFSAYSNMMDAESLSIQLGPGNDTKDFVFNKVSGSYLFDQIAIAPALVPTYTTQLIVLFGAPTFTFSSSCSTSAGDACTLSITNHGATVPLSFTFSELFTASEYTCTAIVSGASDVTFTRATDHYTVPSIPLGGCTLPLARTAQWQYSTDDTTVSVAYNTTPLVDNASLPKVAVLPTGGFSGVLSASCSEINTEPCKITWSVNKLDSFTITGLTTSQSDLINAAGSSGFTYNNSILTWARTAGDTDTVSAILTLDKPTTSVSSTSLIVSHVNAVYTTNISTVTIPTLTQTPPEDTHILKITATNCVVVNSNNGCTLSFEFTEQITSLVLPAELYTKYLLPGGTDPIDCIDADDKTFFTLSSTGSTMTNAFTGTCILNIPRRKSIIPDTKISVVINDTDGTVTLPLVLIKGANITLNTSNCEVPSVSSCTFIFTLDSVTSFILPESIGLHYGFDVDAPSGCTKQDSDDGFDLYTLNASSTTCTLQSKPDSGLHFKNALTPIPTISLDKDIRAVVTIPTLPSVVLANLITVDSTCTPDICTVTYNNVLFNTYPYITFEAYDPLADMELDPAEVPCDYTPPTEQSSGSMKFTSSRCVFTVPVATPPAPQGTQQLLHYQPSSLSSTQPLANYLITIPPLGATNVATISAADDCSDFAQSECTLTFNIATNGGAKTYTFDVPSTYTFSGVTIPQSEGCNVSLNGGALRIVIDVTDTASKCTFIGTKSGSSSLQSTTVFDTTNQAQISLPAVHYGTPIAVTPSYCNGGSLCGITFTNSVTDGTEMYIRLPTTQYNQLLSQFNLNGQDPCETSVVNDDTILHFEAGVTTCTYAFSPLSSYIFTAVSLKFQYNYPFNVEPETETTGSTEYDVTLDAFVLGTPISLVYSPSCYQQGSNECVMTLTSHTTSFKQFYSSVNYAAGLKVSSKPITCTDSDYDVESMGINFENFSINLGSTVKLNTVCTITFVITSNTVILNRTIDAVYIPSVPAHNITVTPIVNIIPLTVESENDCLVDDSTTCTMKYTLFKDVTITQITLPDYFGSTVKQIGEQTVMITILPASATISILPSADQTQIPASFTLVYTITPASRIEKDNTVSITVQYPNSPVYPSTLVYPPLYSAILLSTTGCVGTTQCMLSIKFAADITKFEAPNHFNLEENDSIDCKDANNGAVIGSFTYIPATDTFMFTKSTTSNIKDTQCNVAFPIVNNNISKAEILSVVLDINGQTDPTTVPVRFPALARQLPVLSDSIVCGTSSQCFVTYQVDADLLNMLSVTAPLFLITVNGSNLQSTTPTSMDSDACQVQEIITSDSHVIAIQMMPSEDDDSIIKSSCVVSYLFPSGTVTLEPSIQIYSYNLTDRPDVVSLDMTKLAALYTQQFSITINMPFITGDSLVSFTSTGQCFGKSNCSLVFTPKSDNITKIILERNHFELEPGQYQCLSDSGDGLAQLAVDDTYQAVLIPVDAASFSMDQSCTFTFPLLSSGQDEKLISTYQFLNSQFQRTETWSWPAFSPYQPTGYLYLRTNSTGSFLYIELPTVANVLPYAITKLTILGYAPSASFRQVKCVVPEGGDCSANIPDPRTLTLTAKGTVAKSDGIALFSFSYPPSTAAAASFPSLAAITLTFNQQSKSDGTFKSHTITQTLLIDNSSILDAKWEPMSEKQRIYFFSNTETTFKISYDEKLADNGDASTLPSNQVIRYGLHQTSGDSTPLPLSRDGFMCNSSTAESSCFYAGTSAAGAVQLDATLITNVLSLGTSTFSQQFPGPQRVSQSATVGYNKGGNTDKIAVGAYSFTVGSVQFLSGATPVTVFRYDPAAPSSLTLATSLNSNQWLSESFGLPQFIVTMEQGLENKYTWEHLDGWNMTSGTATETKRRDVAKAIQPPTSSSQKDPISLETTYLTYTFTPTTVQPVNVFEFARLIPKAEYDDQERIWIDIKMYSADTSDLIYTLTSSTLLPAFIPISRLYAPRRSLICGSTYTPLLYASVDTSTSTTSPVVFLVKWSSIQYSVAPRSGAGYTLSSVPNQPTQSRIRITGHTNGITPIYALLSCDTTLEPTQESILESITYETGDVSLSFKTNNGYYHYRDPATHSSNLSFAFDDILTFAGKTIQPKIVMEVSVPSSYTFQLRLPSTIHHRLFSIYSDPTKQSSAAIFDYHYVTVIKGLPVIAKTQILVSRTPKDDIIFMFHDDIDIFSLTAPTHISQSDALVLAQVDAPATETILSLSTITLIPLRPYQGSILFDRCLGSSCTTLRTYPLSIMPQINVSLLLPLESSTITQGVLYTNTQLQLTDQISIVLPGVTSIPDTIVGQYYTTTITSTTSQTTITLDFIRFFDASAPITFKLIVTNNFASTVQSINAKVTVTTGIMYSTETSDDSNNDADGSTSTTDSNQPGSSTVTQNIALPVVSTSPIAEWSTDVPWRARSTIKVKFKLGRSFSFGQKLTVSGLALYADQYYINNDKYSVKTYNRDATGQYVDLDVVSISPVPLEEGTWIEFSINTATPSNSEKFNVIMKSSSFGPNDLALDITLESQITFAAPLDPKITYTIDGAERQIILNQGSKYTVTLSGLGSSSAIWELSNLTPYFDSPSLITNTDNTIEFTKLVSQRQALTLNIYSTNVPETRKVLYTGKILGPIVIPPATDAEYTPDATRFAYVGGGAFVGEPVSFAVSVETPIYAQKFGLPEAEIPTFIMGTCALVATDPDQIFPSSLVSAQAAIPVTDIFGTQLLATSIQHPSDNGFLVRFGAATSTVLTPQQLLIANSPDILWTSQFDCSTGGYMLLLTEAQGAQPISQGLSPWFKVRSAPHVRVRPSVSALYVVDPSQIVYTPIQLTISLPGTESFQGSVLLYVPSSLYTISSQIYRCIDTTAYITIEPQQMFPPGSAGAQYTLLNISIPQGLTASKITCPISVAMIAKSQSPEAPLSYSVYKSASAGDLTEEWFMPTHTPQPSIVLELQDVPSSKIEGKMVISISHPSIRSAPTTFRISFPFSFNVGSSCVDAVGTTLGTTQVYSGAQSIFQFSTSGEARGLSMIKCTTSIILNESYVHNNVDKQFVVNVSDSTPLLATVRFPTNHAGAIQSPIPTVELSGTIISGLSSEITIHGRNMALLASDFLEFSIGVPFTLVDPASNACIDANGIPFAQININKYNATLSNMAERALREQWSCSINIIPSQDSTGRVPYSLLRSTINSIATRTTVDVTDNLIRLPHTSVNLNLFQANVLPRKMPRLDVYFNSASVGPGHYGPANIQLYLPFVFTRTPVLGATCTLNSPANGQITQDFPVILSQQSSAFNVFTISTETIINPTQPEVMHLSCEFPGLMVAPQNAYTTATFVFGIDVVSYVFATANIFGYSVCPSGGGTSAPSIPLGGDYTTCLRFSRVYPGQVLTPLPYDPTTYSFTAQPTGFLTGSSSTVPLTQQAITVVPNYPTSVFIHPTTYVPDMSLDLKLNWRLVPGSGVVFDNKPTPITNFLVLMLPNDQFDIISGSPIPSFRATFSHTLHSYNTLSAATVTWFGMPKVIFTFNIDTLLTDDRGLIFQLSSNDPTETTIGCTVDSATLTTSFAVITCDNLTFSNTYSLSVYFTKIAESMPEDYDPDGTALYSIGTIEYAPFFIVAAQTGSYKYEKAGTPYYTTTLTPERATATHIHVTNALGDDVPFKRGPTQLLSFRVAQTSFDLNTTLNIPLWLMADSRINDYVHTLYGTYLGFPYAPLFSYNDLFSADASMVPLGVAVFTIQIVENRPILFVSLRFTAENITDYIVTERSERFLHLTVPFALSPDVAVSYYSVQMGSLEVVTTDVSVGVDRRPQAFVTPNAFLDFTIESSPTSGAVVAAALGGDFYSTGTQSTLIVGVSGRTLTPGDVILVSLNSLEPTEQYLFHAPPILETPAVCYNANFPSEAVGLATVTALDPYLRPVLGASSNIFMFNVTSSSSSVSTYPEFKCVTPFIAYRQTRNKGYIYGRVIQRGEYADRIEDYRTGALELVTESNIIGSVYSSVQQNVYVRADFPSAANIKNLGVFTVTFIVNAQPVFSDAILVADFSDLPVTGFYGCDGYPDAEMYNYDPQKNEKLLIKFSSIENNDQRAVCHFFYARGAPTPEHNVLNVSIYKQTDYVLFYDKPLQLLGYAAQNQTFDFPSPSGASANIISCAHSTIAFRRPLGQYIDGTERQTLFSDMATHLRYTISKNIQDITATLDINAMYVTNQHFELVDNVPHLVITVAFSDVADASHVSVSNLRSEQQQDGLNTYKQALEVYGTLNTSYNWTEFVTRQFDLTCTSSGACGGNCEQCVAGDRCYFGAECRGGMCALYVDPSNPDDLGGVCVETPSDYNVDNVTYNVEYEQIVGIQSLNYNVLTSKRNSVIAANKSEQSSIRNKMPSSASSLSSYLAVIICSTLLLFIMM